MNRKLLLILTTCALAPAALFAGCGGVPGNAVAEVDGSAIDKESFDHWMSVALKSSGQSGAVVPDPPDFTKCVAALKKQKPVEGQPQLTDSTAKQQCEQQYDALRDQVMRLLIQFAWIEGEAAEQGIEVTDAQVKKAFAEQKKASFPKEADYTKFLKESGQTQADIDRRVKLQLLNDELQKKITKGKDKVTDAQIKAYYDKNQARFAQPERRDLRIVLAKTKAQAEEAKQALEDGESWKSVAKEHSIDEATKSAGGKLAGVAAGQQEKALDDAVFDAKKGQLVGPIKTQFGYYVFEVGDITKAEQQTLEEAKATIQQLLVAENQQKAVTAFAEDFEKRWKDKTDCADDYRAQECSNAPEQTATPTPAAGQTMPATTPTPAP